MLICLTIFMLFCITYLMHIRIIFSCIFALLFMHNRLITLMEFFCRFHAESHYNDAIA
jgi:hypothetical protein